MLPAGSALDEPAAPKQQFKVVILCGYGADLYPLIEPSVAVSSDEETKQGDAPKAVPEIGQVKALLPVAGKRMIDWILEQVHTAGLFDVLVLSPESIAHPLERRALKVDVEKVPEAVARKQTVAILRWAVEQGHIESDFILLPCDLLMTPKENASAPALASMIDRHRLDENLLTTMFYERAASSVAEARKDGPSEILAVYDSRTTTLLDIREMDDYDNDEVPLRTSLLQAFPSPTLSTSLLPSQIYIFSSAVLPLLSDPSHDRRLRHMENLRDLVGWLARLAWRNKGRDAVGYKHPSRVHAEEGLALGRSTTQLPLGRPTLCGLDQSMPPTGANTPALNRNGGNPWEAASALMSDGAIGKKRREGAGGCKLMIWKASDGWCGRGNTVAGYVEMNRHALKLTPPPPTPNNTPSGVFVSDSRLHPTVYHGLGEKVGFKRSIVGKGCIVGKGSKLTNVIAMENVVIGENVKLDNCVLSNGVNIRDRATLRDCNLGRNVVIDFDAQIKNEQIVHEAE